MTHNPETVERVAKAINGPHDPTHIDEDKLRELQDYRWDHQTDKMSRQHRLTQARAALSALPPQEVSVQEAAKVLLDACPNPVFDKLKGPLIGEFSQKFPFVNEDGEEVHAEVNISWVVTKKIVAAALRALSEDTQ